MKTFGEYAKERIKSLGKSQKDLADKLGVSPAYISQIFTGKKKPPDLGRPRNRPQLKIWTEFLAASEEDILDLVRHQLYRVPPRPIPRYGSMRNMLLASLTSGSPRLVEEIRGMELHPAENTAIQGMVQIYLILQEEFSSNRAHGATRFKDMVYRLKANKEFVEGELARFFDERRFSWTWDPEGNDVRFISDSNEIRDAIEKLDAMLGRTPGLTFSRTVPVVGHVSAGRGFEFTDGGYPVGEGFDQVEIPPGLDPALAHRLYCVRVRGNSLREFISEGALLFIKPESWEEIRDGDLVIFKDRKENRAFVKKVEFAGENMILKSMNPLYKNIVLHKSELILLERVLSVVF